MRNRVQLSVVTDRFGGSLRTLAGLLHAKLSGVYEGVRLLPLLKESGNLSDETALAELSHSCDVITTIPAGRGDDSFFTRQAALGVKAVCLEEGNTPSGSRSPLTREEIGRLVGKAHEAGLSLILEAPTLLRRESGLASRVDGVYDPFLPPLLLHALTTGDAAPLAKWVGRRPRNTLTVLAGSNGITLATNLLPAPAVQELVTALDRNTHGESTAATVALTQGLQPSRINCTYYSALGCDDAKYLAARAFQFFLPGVPQVYYAGAMMAPDDMSLLQKTGVGADVSRHAFTAAEIDANLLRPEVKALNALCRFRNTLPAFTGRFSYGYDSTFGVLSLLWQGGGTSARLDFDPRVISDRGELGQNGMDSRSDVTWRSLATITWTDAKGEHKTNKLVENPPVAE